MPTVFEAQLYFYAVALKSGEFGRKKINFVRNLVNSTMAGMVIPHVRKACDELKKLCLLEERQVAIQLNCG